jgi:hypothetical protein
MNIRGGGGATRLKTNMLKPFIRTSWFVLSAFGKWFHKQGMALASPVHAGASFVNQDDKRMA